MNILFFPSLIIFLALYKTGRFIASKTRSTATASLTIITGATLSIPAILLFLNYFHIFDKSQWYYDFRAYYGSELTGSAIGFLAGAISEKTKHLKYGRLSLFTILLIIFISPYLKTFMAPLLWPLFDNTWKEGACIQTTSASCGPCSAASILRHDGLNVTEKMMAKDSFTYVRGTEAWYLARAIKKRGYNVSFIIKNKIALNDVPVPSIAGVRITNGIFKFGHFIAMIEKKGDTYIIADPLDGKHKVPSDKLLKEYKFTGFFMKIQKPGQ